MAQLGLKPISLKAANEFIANHHRHHKPVAGHKFAVAVESDGALAGVAIVGRPVARMLDDGWTAEVLRVCTLGHHNACSFLYSACARAATAMGYRRILTYTLESESGNSLRASSWKDCGRAGGGSWSRKSRPREDKAPIEPKRRWEKDL